MLGASAAAVPGVASEPVGELAASLPSDAAAEDPEDVRLVDVVETAVASPAAFSALVFVGGMISGVVFGTASATLLPPHPPSATAQSPAAAAAAAARATGARERDR